MYDYAKALVMGPGQKLLTWVGSNFCCSGQVSHIWYVFGFGNFHLKIPIFSIFCPLVKKISLGRVGNYPGQSQVGFLFTVGQKYAWVWAGQGPSLQSAQNMYVGI